MWQLQLEDKVETLKENLLNSVDSVTANWKDLRMPEPTIEEYEAAMANEVPRPRPASMRKKTPTAAKRRASVPRAKQPKKPKKT